jgi:hypothetical protein
LPAVLDERKLPIRIVQLKNIRFDNPMFSLTTDVQRETISRKFADRALQVSPRPPSRTFSTPLAG